MLVSYYNNLYCIQKVLTSFYDLFQLHRLCVIEDKVMIISGDQVRIWKQAVTNFFMVLFKHLPGPDSDQVPSKYKYLHFNLKSWEMGISRFLDCFQWFLMETCPFFKCYVLFRTQGDGKVQKPSNTNCNIPSLKFFRTYEAHIMNSSCMFIRI